MGTTNSPPVSSAYTYATLPHSAAVALGGVLPAGTSYLTTDAGICVWDGAKWVPSTAPSITLPLTGYRTALIGDSYFGQGFYYQTINTSAGNFVVSNGVATITTAAQHLLTPGNYVSFFNNQDNVFSLALNGGTVKVLSVSSNTVFTCPASYNGVTMPDGDYSNYFASSPWYVYNLANTTDSAHFRFHNYFNNGIFLTTNLCAFIAARSDQVLTLMPKLLAGAAFDVAWVNLGANDMALGTQTTAQALVSAQNALNNTITICNQLIALGKTIVLCIPCPVGTGLSTGNIQQRNIGLAQLRQGLLKYAHNTPAIRVIDAFRHSISGTAANGDFATSFGFTDGVHLSSYGCYQVAKYENQISTLGNIGSVAQIAKNLDFEPLSILEDPLTYAQAFPAWAATTAYSFSTSPSGATVPAIVRNNGNLYALAKAGTSGAASTGGPSGTVNGISDGTCTWNYQGAVQINSLAHGLMDGTTAVNGATGYTSLTGTMPTGWVFANNLTGTITSLVSTGQAARATATNSNQTNWGYGWNFVANWGATGNTVSVTQEMSAQLAADGTTLHAAAGGWYRFGCTINANGAFANVANVAMQLVLFGSPYSFQFNANKSLPNTTSMPMANGDQIQIVSEPVYIAPGTSQASGSNVYVNVTSSAASGSASWQLASVWVRAIENPYSPTTYGV